MPAKITEAQQKVLQLISDRIDRDGLPPTYAEIAKELKFNSDNAAFCHVKALAAKGLVEMRESISRGISITDLGESHLFPAAYVETDVLISDFMSYRSMYTAAREELASRIPKEITPEQFMALQIASEGPICASELAKRCDVKGPSLSRMLDTLEGLKAIKRVPDPADTRRTIVRIQAKGVKLLRAAK